MKKTTVKTLEEGVRRGASPGEKKYPEEITKLGGFDNGPSKTKTKAGRK